MIVIHLEGDRKDLGRNYDLCHYNFSMSHFKWKLRGKFEGRKENRAIPGPEMRCSSTHILENETRTDASVRENTRNRVQVIITKTMKA